MPSRTRVFAALFLVAVAGLPAASVPAPAASLTPVFTFPPTDIANVAGVVPLGNVSPSSGHIIPVDHMYLRYPDQPYDGSRSYPVRAMAARRIVMAIRQQNDAHPPNYQLYIRHNRHVTSYFIYLYTLSDRIGSYLESTGSGWIEVGGPAFRVMILGREGAPGRLPVAAGEELGSTSNYHESWDVGVIDDRVSGSFLGLGPRRYPRFGDLLALLGYPPYNPVPGQETVNAASFIRYLSPEHKAAWRDQLVSVPKRHGRTGWDVAGRLRGVWFNPAVDSATPAPLFDLEQAAITIVPDNRAPTSRTQIAIPSGHPLAILDPSGIHPQLRYRFVVDTDFSPGARINPNPRSVGPGTGTVCYDLFYDNGGTPAWNTLQLHLTGPRRLAVRLDPAPLAAPGCAAKLSQEPDHTWAVYKR